MAGYYGIATDVYAGTDKELGVPLAEAVNVDLTADGALTPRYAAVLYAGAPPEAEAFFNFGRQLHVDGEFLYGSPLPGEDTPVELLYIYVGPAPRILWCTNDGTYVSVVGKLVFLAGGEWPPKPRDVLMDDVLSTNVATAAGVPHGYILTRTGAWKLDSAGNAERVDNEQFSIPADFGPVAGVVFTDSTGLERVVFSESAL